MINDVIAFKVRRFTVRHRETDYSMLLSFSFGSFGEICIGRQSAFMTYRIGGAATLFVLGAIASGTWLRLPVDRWHAAHLVAQGVFGIWVVQ